jgi:16S rRNA G966 N2-methylase RsmD
MKTEHSIPLIAAKTHPREYLLHKYWSRKPHNVIGHFLKTFSGEGKVVVDTFCGSGVALLEAKRLGFACYGFDVNPIAALISRVTVAPPPLDTFSDTITELLAEFDKFCATAYGVDERQVTVKYNVHELVVVCPGCRKVVAHNKSGREGRLYKCLECSTRLHFNLEQLVRTRIIRTILNNGRIAQADVVHQEQEKADLSYYPASRDYDYPFAENRRILTFRGMTTKSLFTTRNFSLLAWLADRCREIDSESIRDAAFLLLTASAAQCSRLIPHRNNMTTGGPAWSVPGFWVPPVHLETNPAFHLRARYRKLFQGFSALHRNYKKKSTVSVQCMDCSESVPWLRKRSIKADVVFFDPPYGDSVPFLEFSQLWNSFLKQMPKLDHDLSVSDRLPQDNAWKHYERRIAGHIVELAEILSEHGRLIVTFNNSDVRAWVALLRGLQKGPYQCTFVSYQIPAVVSSKSQFSPDGSYISDIYSIWKRAKSDQVFDVNPRPVVQALERCAVSRDGLLSRSLANKVFMVSALETNRSYKCISDRDSIIESLFTVEGNILRWKEPLSLSTPRFRDIAIVEATNIFRRMDRVSWNELYEAIANGALTAGVGIPDPKEAREALQGSILVGRDGCRLLEAVEEQQLALFT